MLEEGGVLAGAVLVLPKEEKSSPKDEKSKGSETPGAATGAWSKPNTELASVLDEGTGLESNAELKSPNGSLNGSDESEELATIAGCALGGATGRGRAAPPCLGGGASKPPLGGGSRNPVPPFDAAGPLLLPSFFVLNFIFIFSPAFKVKSALGPAGVTDSVSACFSRSHSPLNSDNATLKSNESFLSLNAMPMNACLPWAFEILKTKYLPLSKVFSTAESSVTWQTANTWFVFSSVKIMAAMLPLATILTLPLQVGSFGQSLARCPSALFLTGILNTWT